MPEQAQQKIKKELADLHKELNTPGLLEGKLTATAEKVKQYLDQYETWAQTNPILAKTAQVSARLIAGALISGVVGLTKGGIAGAALGAGISATNSIITEFQAALLNQVVGPTINEVVDIGIKKYSPLLQKLDSTLTLQQAALLGSVLVAATASTIDFAAFTRNIKNVRFTGMTKDGKAVNVVYSKNVQKVDVSGGKSNLIDSFKKWEIKSPKDADKIVGSRFGKLYRDPTQKIDNKEIWWTKDTAHHGGSEYKIFIEEKNRFRHIADIDKNGNIMSKHKGPTGKLIKRKDTWGIK